jgi:hypothetical protein
MTWIARLLLLLPNRWLNRLAKYKVSYKKSEPRE